MKSKIITCLTSLSIIYGTIAGQTVKNLKSVGIDEVTIIEIAQSGDAWVGTAGDGVYHFNSNTGQLITHFTKDSFPDLASDTINAISLNGDFSGNSFAYVGTPYGLSCIKNGNIGPALQPDTNVIALCIKPGANVISYTKNVGAVVWNDTSETQTGRLNSFPFVHLSCAVGPVGYSCDSAGYTIGSIDSGACYTYDNVNYSVIPGLVSDSVTAVFRTQNCNARVIGTRHGFSFCPDNMPCQNYDTLRDNYITAITQDCKGNIWLGTRSAGIAVFTPPTQSFRWITTANGLTSDSITTLAILSDSNTCVNTTYVGTTDGSVTMVDSTYNAVGLLNGIKQVDNISVKVRVFPQPTTDEVNFLFETALNNAQFSFTDLNGRVLGTSDLKNVNKFTLNVSGIAPGLYIYRLYNGTAIFTTGKFEVLK